MLAVMRVLIVRSVHIQLAARCVLKTRIRPVMVNASAPLPMKRKTGNASRLLSSARKVSILTVLSAFLTNVLKVKFLTLASACLTQISAPMARKKWTGNVLNQSAKKAALWALQRQPTCLRRCATTNAFIRLVHRLTLPYVCLVQARALPIARFSMKVPATPVTARTSLQLRLEQVLERVPVLALGLVRVLALELVPVLGRVLAVAVPVLVVVPLCRAQNLKQTASAPLAPINQVASATLMKK